MACGRGFVQRVAGWRVGDGWKLGAGRNAYATEILMKSLCVPYAFLMRGALSWPRFWVPPERMR